MLEEVNYKGFVWPLIVGTALFLLTPFKPATITIAGWQWRQDLLVWLGSRGHRASTDFLPAGAVHVRGHHAWLVVKSKKYVIKQNVTQTRV